ncbi:MAG TPA: DUF5723 family protein, partial [Chitinophagales bacterium]|nr:DUF5723 family protein [Chitinophagales bacterium]
GITYSRVVLDKKASMLKIGGTVKLIQPLGAAYTYAHDLSYKWSEQGILNIYNTNVGYAYSDGLVTSKGYPGSTSEYLRNAYAFKYGRPTIAADIGFVYEWRPDRVHNKHDMDCHCIEPAERNRYKVAVGFSMVDFGAMRFVRGANSADYYADIQNWDVSKAQFPDGLQSLDDTINSRFEKLPSGKYFTIWLPTRFNLFVDYNVIKDFNVNFTANIAPDMAPHGQMVHEVTTFSIIPNYDTKWFGVYVPVSYDVYGNFGLGATLRAGPLTIGTGDILGLFVRKYVYKADIHAALKITIPNHKICRKGDLRFSGVL